MTCQRCSSARILNVNSHGRDCNVFRIGRHEHEGYVPAEFGIGCGDDVEFAMCLECGQVQGAFPIGLTSLEMKEIAERDRIINDLIVGAKDEKWEELGRVMAEGIQDRLWGNTKGW